MGAGATPPEVTVLSVAPGASTSLERSEKRLIDSALRLGEFVEVTPPVLRLITKLNKLTKGRLGGRMLALLDAVHDVRFWRARQGENS
jgi:hypothetical protein